MLWYAVGVRILAIEPFYGGSHRAVLDGWRKYSEHQIEIVDLPATAWKWRLAGAAPALADKLGEIWGAGPDLIWASSMTNLSMLVALFPALREVPKVYYFHEFQGTYPRNPRTTDKGYLAADADLNYTLMQVMSAAVADRIWFNSGFLRQLFLDAVAELRTHWPEPRPAWDRDFWDRKDAVVEPGVEICPEGCTATSGAPWRIAWNHRWAWDKQPEKLGRLFAQFHGSGLPVVPVLLGSGRDRWLEEHPEEARLLAQAEKPECTSREDYCRALGSCHFVLSTAVQENFGLAVAEAAASGVIPIVPDRLVYRRMYPDPFRYGTVDEIISMLRGLSQVWKDNSVMIRGVATQWLWNNQVKIWDKASEVAIGDREATIW